MFLRSAQLERDVPLLSGRVLIGRRKDCDVVLHSKLASVSRQHAELRVTESLVELRDLESHNGTTLAGRKLEPYRWHRLVAGDIFQVCEFKFQLLDAADAGSLSDTRVYASTQDSFDSLKLSASVAVSGLESDRQSNARGQLRGVFAIAKSLRNVLQLDHILAKTAESLLTIFPHSQLIALALLAPDGQLQLQNVRRRDEFATGDVILSQTIVSHVLRRGEAVLFADASKALDQADSVLEANARAVLAAPIIDGEGRIAGLIYVDSPVPNDFGEEDVELLVSVSSMISMAFNFSTIHKTAMLDAMVRRDVENARIVQQSYLPGEPPKIDNYQVAAFYRAARHIGGDYYDFIHLADGRLAIVLGDVAGKGVPAALTMVRLATEARACFETLCSPAEVMKRLNRKLGSSYITLLVIVLDPQRHTLTVANAGHEYPIMIDRDGRLTEISGEFSGFPISTIDDEDYVDRTIAIEPGTSLTIFSDGFPDAEDAEGERFGKHRIGPLLAQFVAQPDTLIQQVVAEVDHFIGDHPQFDDMCLVHLCRLC